MKDFLLKITFSVAETHSVNYSEKTFSKRHIIQRSNSCVKKKKSKLLQFFKTTEQLQSNGDLEISVKISDTASEDDHVRSKKSFRSHTWVEILGN